MRPAPINLSWWHLVYDYAPWALLGLAVLLFLLALFTDRSRGRRRCPRCWYDMRGTPGLRCPECGREARRERALFRTRRRWRRAALVLPILLAAWVTANIPRMQASGPVGLFPTWTITLASLVYETADQRLFGEIVARIEYEQEKPNALERRLLARRLARAFREPDAPVTLPTRSSVPAWSARFAAISPEPAAYHALGLMKDLHITSMPAIRAASNLLQSSTVADIRGLVIDLVAACDALPERVPLLVSALRNDADTPNRAAAARSLGSIRRQPDLAVPALIEGLAHPSWICSTCAEALGKFGPDAAPAVDPLNTIAHTSQSESMILVAMRAMRDIGTDEARDRLVDMAFTPSNFAQTMSMQIASAHADFARRCAELIRPEAAVGRESPRQIYAIAALIRLSSSCNVTPELAAAVTGANSPHSRADALEAIWSDSLLPDADIVQLASRALDDSSERVRRQAARALSAVLPRLPEAAAPLERARSDPDEIVRHTATSALNQRSP